MTRDELETCLRAHIYTGAREASVRIRGEILAAFDALRERAEAAERKYSKALDGQYHLMGELEAAEKRLAELEQRNAVLLGVDVELARTYEEDVGHLIKEKDAFESEYAKALLRIAELEAQLSAMTKRADDWLRDKEAIAAERDQLREQLAKAQGELEIYRRTPPMSGAGEYVYDEEK